MACSLPGTGPSVSFFICQAMFMRVKKIFVVNPHDPLGGRDQPHCIDEGTKSLFKVLPQS